MYIVLTNQLMLNMTLQKHSTQGIVLRQQRKYNPKNHLVTSPSVYRSNTLTTSVITQSNVALLTMPTRSNWTQHNIASLKVSFKEPLKLGILPVGYNSSADVAQLLLRYPMKLIALHFDRKRIQNSIVTPRSQRGIRLLMFPIFLSIVGNL